MQPNKPELARVKQMMQALAEAASGRRFGLVSFHRHFDAQHAVVEVREDSVSRTRVSLSPRGYVAGKLIGLFGVCCKLCAFAVHKRRTPLDCGFFSGFDLEKHRHKAAVFRLPATRTEFDLPFVTKQLELRANRHVASSGLELQKRANSPNVLAASEALSSAD